MLDYLTALATAEGEVEEILRLRKIGEYQDALGAERKLYRDLLDGVVDAPKGTSLLQKLQIIRKVRDRL